MVHPRAKVLATGTGFWAKSTAARWATKGLAILLGVVGLVVFAWATLLSTVVEHELRNVTGFDFHLAVLSANPFSGHVTVQGLAANNPPGYPTPDFVQLRELGAKVELYPWLFSRKIVVDDLDLDLEKIVLVRRHDGKTNVGQLMAAFAASSTPTTSKPAPYLLKALHLRVDRLVFSDFEGDKPVERTYQLNIDQSYSNVSDWRQLLVPNLMKSIKPGLLELMVRLFPGNFGHAISSAFSELGMEIKATGKRTESFLKSLFDRHPKPKP
jgi:hypothetical protein